jgi:hypothetical protein
LKIFDDVLIWDGYGGKFNLAAGRCRLRLFDLSKDENVGVPHLKPMIAVVSDLPVDRLPAMKKVSVRACISHVATTIAHRFKIDPNRMVLVEYYPRETYGTKSEKVIPEKYDMVDLKWHGDKAIVPQLAAPDAAPAGHRPLPGRRQPLDPIPRGYNSNQRDLATTFSFIVQQPAAYRFTWSSTGAAYQVIA